MQLIKRYAMAVIFAVLTIAGLSYFNSAKADTQAKPIVQVGQSYRVLVGMGAMELKVLEVGRTGLVKVQAVGDSGLVGFKKGSIWWLNLNQALLIEAK